MAENNVGIGWQCKRPRERELCTPNVWLSGKKNKSSIREVLGLSSTSAFEKE
jgi:hypothetical protein